MAHHVKEKILLYIYTLSEMPARKWNESGYTRLYFKFGDENISTGR